MGMTHRGRLNVLGSVMRKSFDQLFEQFSENYIPDTVGGDGDVKYHLGYESVLTTTSGKKVEVRLAANPSHLEIVDPVVEGKTRARQRMRGDTEERRRVLALLIHGDAAIAGQGIVAETLNFSQLAGYRTGGTVHFVINNQIGFTTDPADARSTRYCTDVAKMIEAPIFHVNGDDPEAVCMVSQLALDFRVRWKRDVFIDMYCFRRHGPQRDRRAVLHAADALQEDRRASPGLGDLHGAAGGRRLHHRRRRATRSRKSIRRRSRRTSRRRRSARRPGPRSGPGRATRSAAPRAQFQPEYQPHPRPDRGPRRGDRAGRPRADDGARGLQGEPQDQAPAGRPRPGPPGGRARGLGLRRGARVRLAPCRGDSRPPERPGLRAGNLQPPPRRPRGRRDGRDVHPAQEHRPQAGALLRLQLPPVRGRRPRLRLRLLA